jgi:hypothetical protein
MCPPLPYLIGRLVLVVLITSRLAAQEDFGAWFIPVIRPYTVSLSGQVQHEAEISSNAGTYGRSLGSLRATSQVWQDQQHEFVIAVGRKESDFSGDLVLGDIGPLPDRLRETSIGALWRNVEENGRIYGLAGEVRSSDRSPFRTGAGTATSATAFTRVPVDTDAWILSLTYNENAAVLRGVPLPGLLYEWHPDAQLTVLAGIPLCSMMWRAESGTSATAMASFFGTLRGHVGTAPFSSMRWLRCDAAVGYGAESWEWTERLDDADDRLLIRAAQATFTVSAHAGPANRIALFAGWEWSRAILVGRGLFDTDTQASLPPGAVLGVSAQARW